MRPQIFQHLKSEQVAVCVRYVNGNSKIKEVFLQFFETNSLRGRDLAGTIINGLISCGVDCEYMIGQGYDGAGNMAGKFNGVQAVIREQYPKAIYVHCAAHSLNLAISQASEIQSVRNCLGTVGKMYDFFNTPKRKSILTSIIENSETNPHARSLKRLCVTRWVAKYDSINDFIELVPYVYEALEDIYALNDSASTDARHLVNAMDFEFFVSLFVVHEIFSYSLPLCRLYQKETIDLRECVVGAECAVRELSKIRMQAEHEFSRIYKKAKSVAESVAGVTESIKRIAKVQKNRVNIAADSAEDYYRISIFIPYVDYFLTQLKERFLNHEQVFNGFMCLFRHETSEQERLQFESLVHFYAPLIEPSSFAELRLWKTRMSKDHLSLKCASEALQKCDKVVFPNVYKLLQILCTLPVSTATPERSFSSLKRIKTYLRNATGQSRLNGLAMLSMHKDVSLTADEVIDEMAKKPRKIVL